jgi:hypothetical protein
MVAHKNNPIYTIDIKIINTPKLADSSIIFYTPFSTSHLVLIYYLTPKVFGHSVVPLWLRV